MKRMTVGELIDELSGYDRSQRVSVYFRGLDLTPYKLVEHADETEIAIYATQFIGDPGSHYSDLALSMVNKLDKPEHHFRPREWAEAMAKRINNEIGLPMVEAVTVEGHARVCLRSPSLIAELPSEAPSAFSLLEERTGMKMNIGPDQDEERLRSEWQLGDYDNGETGCPHCGRSRLCICPNGKHRCEKCNWSPELNDYAPTDL